MSKKDKLIYQILKIIKEGEQDTFNFIVPNVLANKLATYMSMRQDLLHIRRSSLMLLGFLEANGSQLDMSIRETVMPSLWYSNIVMYGRCFTDASIGKKGKLEKVIFGENAELIETHDLLMDLRHNFVAHRGDTENEVALVYLKLEKGEKARDETQYRIKTLRMQVPSSETLKNCIKLYDYLLKHVEIKMQKHAEKVNRAYLDTFDPEQIAYLLINNIDLSKTDGKV